MARIPEEVIERLKAEVDLVGLVETSGVALKKAGADLVGCCPFHEDRTPSLVVTAEKGLWHCLGACQAGGSVIDWVMRTEGVSFRHAVELLREGITPTVTPTTPLRSSVRRLPPPVEASAEDAELLGQVVDYYHATLLESPDALDYLATRRIDDPETIAHFRLGYANRTLGLRLPQKNRKAGAEVRGRLETLGVFRSSGHEHLAGSLVIPVASPEGVVTDLYGRKLTPNLRPGTALHLYLPGPHRGVFNAEALRDGEAILCESLLDALSFYSAGFRNVTSSYGTAGFTDAHREAFADAGVVRVLLAYDHDAAGDEAATALAGELREAGIECLRVVFPYGQDANDVATAAAKPAVALGRALRAAEWMGAGKLARPKAGRDATVTEVAAVTEGEDDGTGQPLPSSAAVPVAAVPVSPPATPLAHDELVLEMGRRRWRVRHIPKAPSPGSLRVNVMVSSGERFHVDTVDLYSAKQRAAYVEATVTELRADREELKAEVGQVLLATEDAQSAACAPAEPSALPVMSGERREDALSLLGAPDLLEQVADAFVTLGVVGEQTSALVTWLTLTSRLSDRPLGAVIQSSSSAGKSTLADAALALMPSEATVAYSAMTGQALYYLGETDLAHKVLSIAEEEGASRASYALKLLVSEGRLSIAAAGKDPVSGRLVTHTYEVTGPVALLMTTTSPELDEELANRLLVLAVDEGRRQTRLVHDAQRHAETLDGLVARQVRADVIARHTNAQRLLHPVSVVNPHAPTLSFSDRSTRHRRDNAKFLGLIRAVTLAHQHQREKKQVVVGGKAVTYIEATEADVTLAEGLCATVLATTTDDLSPATRRLLGAIGDFCATNGERFTRRALRDATGLGDSQLKVHLARLVDLEYVSVERAGPATTYELATGPGERTGRDRPDVERHRPGADADRPGIGRFSGPPEGRSSSQVTGEPSDDGDRSAGIGRIAPNDEHGDEQPVPSRKNPSSTPDRLGLRQIRGTGGANERRGRTSGAELSPTSTPVVAQA